MNDDDGPDPDVDYFRRGIVFCALFVVFITVLFILIEMYVEI